MSKFIPNERSKVYFAAALADEDTVATSDIASAVDLTPLLISLNASSQGNTVPTPTIDTLFETSIPGTVQAAFSADFYRDDDEDADIAWRTLPRGTQGFMIISREGPADGVALKASDKVEKWPVWVVSRTMSNMASNTPAAFTMQASVYQEPDEEVTLS